MIRKIEVWETGDGEFHRLEEHAKKHEEIRLAIPFDQICPDCNSPIKYHQHDYENNAYGYCKCLGTDRLCHRKYWIITEESEPNKWRPL